MYTTRVRFDVHLLITSYEHTQVHLFYAYHPGAFWSHINRGRVLESHPPTSATYARRRLAAHNSVDAWMNGWMNGILPFRRYLARMAETPKGQLFSWRGSMERRSFGEEAEEEEGSEEEEKQEEDDETEYSSSSLLGSEVDNLSRSSSCSRRQWSSLTWKRGQ